jgi:peptide-methionine (R)-S-oxide reductase
MNVRDLPRPRATAAAAAELEPSIMTTTRRTVLALGLGGAALAAGKRLWGADTMSTAAPSTDAQGHPAFWSPSGTAITPKVVRTDEEWQKLLTPEQYRVLRKQGTEQAFTGALWNNHDKGIYRCAGCGLELFDSHTKFESGTGWPSFWQPIKPDRVGTTRDFSLGMVREEVHCARCDGHQGHLFDDGPEPTGMRYCMNSVSMIFEKR